jgi:U4/U6 small nuclear ribonucleoprotein PRP3
LVPDPTSGLTYPSLVIVEGGPKAIKKYKILMLRRIKWEQKALKGEKTQTKIEEDPNNDTLIVEPVEDTSCLKGNTCSLVWEGVMKDHYFNKWKVIDYKSEIEAKRALEERGVLYYWDMAMNS